MQLVKKFHLIFFKEVAEIFDLKIIDYKIYISDYKYTVRTMTQD